SPAVNKPKTPEPAHVGFVISKGSNLSDVAEGLNAAGVITDKQAFIKEATKQRINSHIQTGTYTFTVGENYQSIIRKISEKPSGNP
ncbi:endolytic transglycosylase MltG, partial [Paenibacillus dakarensis]|uniref:endolytic transglycosylase MltG n=1 Tax=Paenibacillus dakarensis TaxID=1527293 RepID=UPI000B20A6C6